MCSTRLGVLVVLGIAITTSVSAGGPDCNGNGVPDEIDVLQWVRQPELFPADGAVQAGFGESVAISGDVAVVGVPSIFGVGDNSAYVFHRGATSWERTARLVPENGSPDDRFGFSVAASGDLIVVGAPFAGNFDDHRGAVYVFRWNGADWVEEATLLPFVAVATDNFGFSVAVSGEVILVGAIGDRYNGENAGAAYAFRNMGSGWDRGKKLIADDNEAGDMYGFSVALSGQTAVIGVPGDDDNGPGSGSAHLLRDFGWTWSDNKLLAANGRAGDAFGSSVGAFHDLAAVGAPLHAENGVAGGSVYLFRRSGIVWGQEAELLLDEVAAFDVFGGSVAVAQDSVIVGARGDDGDGSLSGAAYVFRRSGTNWVHEAEIHPAAGLPGEAFGAAVAVDGDVALVGAPMDDDIGADAGSAWAFQFRGLDCNANDVPDECDIGEGQSADVNANGVPDECEADCNGNEIPDESEIADGDSPDCDGNGVPDECDVFQWVRRPKLPLNEGERPDGFGESIAVSGDLAVVGAPFVGFSSNSAFVFRRIGTFWRPEARLVPGDGNAQERFGSSVALSGDVIVVGAARGDSAYVYRESGSQWIQEARLVPDDGAVGNGFGSSVAVFGDVVLVGADRDDDNGNDSGAVYVFRNTGTGWEPEAKMFSDVGVDPVSFGASASLVGDTALIGAPNDHDNGPFSGAAYVFRNTGNVWIQEAKLLATDGGVADVFGWSLALSGNRAIIGSPYHTEGGVSAGAAYVYARNDGNWVEEAKLTGSDGVSGDQFGWSVCFSDQTAVVGVPGDDSSGFEYGAAYVFRRTETGWTQSEKFLPADGRAFDAFGHAVAISGDVALIADQASVYYGLMRYRGSVHEFRYGGLDCNANETPDACDIDDGTSGDCNINRLPDECEADCNANGTPDDCDVISGASPDCNVNLVPDECDIAGVDSADCNANGVPDECDLADGTSRDCNGNSVPDACDIAEDASLDVNTNGVLDQCEPCVTDAGCDDGVYCNGPEVCIEFEGCAEGQRPCGIGQSCDEFAGACFNDCNANLMQDVCEIDCGPAGGACDIPGCGLSNDCNANGMPDVCDTSRWNQEQTLLPVAGAERDRFGTSAAIEGNVLVVAADGAIGNEPHSGYADVFRRSGATWLHEARLVLDDGSGRTLVGTYVAVSGDTVVVAASYDDGVAPLRGAAFVFRKTNDVWSLEATLSPVDGLEIGQFGRSAAVRGDTVVIGAFDSSDGPRGLAVVFRRSNGTWHQTAKLFPESANPVPSLGSSVALNADTIFVGAETANAVELNAYGAVYVFRQEGSNWVQKARLLADDAHLTSHFGHSISVSGDTLLIGAPEDGDNGYRSGSAYMFKRSGTTWSQERKIVPFDGEADGAFGAGVALRGDVAMIGSPGDDDISDGAGAAYVFRRDGAGWHQTRKLLASDGARYNRFGQSVAVSDDTAIIGSPGSGDSVQDIGAAYVFEFARTDCNGNGTPDDCDVIGGDDFDGDGDVDLDDFSGFVGCVSAPGETPTICVNSCLSAFDADGDGDVDLFDFGQLQRAFVGSGG